MPHLNLNIIGECRIPASTKRLHVPGKQVLPWKRMKHGQVKPLCLLVKRGKKKVQTLLESRPSDNARKDPKYPTHCAHGWDPKHPIEAGLMPPHRWKHILGPRIYQRHRSLPIAHQCCGLAETPLAQPLRAQLAGAWMTCSSLLSTPASSNMSHQEGSLSRNSPHTMGQLILLTTLCIIDSS